MVLGVCRRVLRDHHDAEDAFQATFLILARKAGSVRPGSMLPNWLYGVAHRVAIKADAINARRRSRERQVTTMPEPETMPEVDADELHVLLDRELSRLPARYRVPVVLCDLEGLGHKEAALRLGWPIGTVSGRLSRARALLARRLSRRGLVLSAGSLAVALGQESASASVPASLLSLTIETAIPFAAGQAIGARSDLRPGCGPFEANPGRHDDDQADRDGGRLPGRWNAAVRRGSRGSPHPGRAAAAAVSKRPTAPRRRRGRGVERCEAPSGDLAGRGIRV